MFARITPSGHVAIYESFYDKVKKTSRQRTVKSLGSVKALKAKGIDDPLEYAKSLIPELMIQNQKDAQTDSYERVGDVEVIKNIGQYFLRAIDNSFGLKNPLDLFGQDFLSKKAKASDILQDLIVARTLFPASKKKTYTQILPTLSSNISYSLDDVYSALEFFGQNSSRIVGWYRKMTEEVYRVDTSHVFFDCTNYYFEIDKSDELRQKGPSKEHRQDPLVSMGLLLDANLIPINMTLFPGNQSEKPKLKIVLDELKRDLNKETKTIRIADKGLNCTANVLDALLSGDGYIFSKSLKTQSSTERTWALSESGFREYIDIHTRQPLGRIKSVVDVFSYTHPTSKKPIEVREKRIVVLNYALRRKQLEEIDKMVEKAQKLCVSKAKRREFGPSACFVEFVTKEGSKKDVVPKLNTKSIEKARACAGFNMLVTSEYMLKSSKVYEIYHELWRIEETFRTLKSFLDARPVYLQRPNRIKGHFLVCYLSVLLVRLFQFYHLKHQFSTQAIFEFLRGLKILEVSPKTYMNLSTRSEVGDYIVQNTRLLVDKSTLCAQDLKRIVEMKKRDLPKVEFS